VFNAGTRIHTSDTQMMTEGCRTDEQMNTMPRNKIPGATTVEFQRAVMVNKFSNFKPFVEIFSFLSSILHSKHTLVKNLTKIDE
jgi:hypothetical protein